MRHVTLPLLAAFAVCAAPAYAADTYDLDPVHSAALFSVSHLDVSRTHGRFNGISGTLTWDATDAAKSAISITIQTESVDTGNEKRDQHLRLPDFFNTKQFATMTFVSKSFTKVDDKTYTVAGEMTLAGTTKPLSVTVKKIGEGKNPYNSQSIIGFETSFAIKRSDFNIKGVPAVGDQVDVTFALEAAKK